MIDISSTAGSARIHFRVPEKGVEIDSFPGAGMEPWVNARIGTFRREFSCRRPGGEMHTARIASPVRE